MNPTQKVPTFRAGQALTADSLNHAVRALLGMIKPGRGILVKPMGNNIEISAEGQGIPRGGGGDPGAGVWCKTATTKAALEEPVSEIYFGRVTSGDDGGMMCVRNPDNNGWNAFTHFE